MTSLPTIAASRVTGPRPAIGTVLLTARASYVRPLDLGMKTKTRSTSSFGTAARETVGRRAPSPDAVVAPKTSRTAPRWSGNSLGDAGRLGSRATPRAGGARGFWTSSRASFPRHGMRATFTASAGGHALERAVGPTSQHDGCVRRESARAPDDERTPVLTARGTPSPIVSSWRPSA